MTAPTAVQGVRIGPEGLPEHTLGWQILGWITDNLQQPDGPLAGHPFRLTDEQARFLLWWYAVDAQGRFLYSKGMYRRMKGAGKTPLAVAICCVEFVGPCRFSHWKDGKPVAAPHPSAWIQIAAVAREQVKNAMTLFPGTLGKMPAGQQQGRAIEEHSIDLGKEIIYAHQGRCRIEAVTSSPRALEGGRPTLTLKEEPHHWLSSNEGHAMSEVIARNAAKSRGGSSRVLAFSNAHNPGEDSDAERDYEAWLQMEAGKTRGRGFLYDSLEAPPDIDLADPDSLRAGLLAARGDSEWLDIDRLVEEIYDPRTPPSVARRFYLNQIIAAEDAWLSPQEWDACAAAGVVVDAKEQVTLGFDGSKSRDHSVLAACRVSDSYLFPLGMWDPATFADNLIPTADVDAAVRRAFETYDVVGFYSDVNEWESYTDTWEQDFGEQLCARAAQAHPIKWDMRRSREAAMAAQSYHDAIVERDLTHSNDPGVNQHHYNARRRMTNIPDVVTFAKESAFSSRKVDAVAAYLLARKARQDYLVLPESRRRAMSPAPSVYELRGVLSFP